MNIKKLLERISPWLIVGMPGLLHEAFFQTVNSIIYIRLYRKRRNCLGQNNWPELLGVLLHGTQAPQCTIHWAIQLCKPHPSKTALSGQHINTSLYLPCMQLHSENISQAIRVKIKIYRSTKQVTLVCCIFNFYQLHCFVFYESLNIQFN